MKGRLVKVLNPWFIGRPVADGHKQYDAHIVQNSIIFKWKETRDKFRRQADISALVKGIEQLSAEKSDVSPAL